VTGPAPTRILIITDSPALPTGLAETTRLIFGNLLAKYPGQYELHQVGLCHCYAVTQPQWPVHPTMTFKDSKGKVDFVREDIYGQKTFFRVVAKVRPDIVFAFGDPQNFLYLCLPPGQRKHKLVLYINFDGLPMPPDFGPALANADLIFTKSEFSKNVVARCLASASAGKLDYRYSPADLARFSPPSANERAEMRQDLLPEWMPRDAFVLGWVGRNQWRKQVWLLYKVLHYLRTGAYLVCRACGRVSLYDWDPARQEHLDGSGEVLESHPGYRFDRCVHCDGTGTERAAPLTDIFLWCHMAEEPGETWSLRMLEQQFAVHPGKDLCYTPEHKLMAALAPEDLPALYKIWDCLLYLSGGEGFGLPAWEAMCSGLPVVYTNYSAHGEFLTRADGGLPVGGVLQPEPKSCIWRMVADVGQAIEAVRRLYFDRGLVASLGGKGRAFTECFDIQTQVAAWHETFGELLRPKEAPLSAAMLSVK
jgi:glycosyltransferase involved in cell wall biosynthesis